MQEIRRLVEISLHQQFNRPQEGRSVLVPGFKRRHRGGAEPALTRARQNRFEGGSVALHEIQHYRQHFGAQRRRLVELGWWTKERLGQEQW